MTSHRSVRAEGADIRKTLQLCKQVERTLSLVLTGECSDDVLRDLLVTSVEPIDGTSQLLVTVQPFDIDSTPDAIVIVEHLQSVLGSVQMRDDHDRVWGRFRIKRLDRYQQLRRSVEARPRARQRRRVRARRDHG